LEKEYNSSKADTTWLKLIYKIGAEIQNTKDQETKNNLYRKGILYSSNPGQENMKETFMAELLKSNPNKEKDVLFELATLKNQNEDKEIGGILFAGFIKSFPNDPRVKSVKESASRSILNDRSYFDLLKKDVTLQASANGLNEEKALKYVDHASAFALGFAGSTSAPDYLMVSADLCRALGDINRTIGFYDWVHKYYPDHKDAKLALFLQAYETDSRLKKYEDAGKLYQQFLTQYPNDPLSKDVRFLMSNLGKAPDTLFKEMQYESKK
jgi:tetratricopeptide (TPR) repeat protein